MLPYIPHLVSTQNGAPKRHRQLMVAGATEASLAFQARSQRIAVVAFQGAPAMADLIVVCPSRGKSLGTLYRGEV